MTEIFKGYHCPKCKLTIGEDYIKWDKPPTQHGGKSVIMLPSCMACKERLEIIFDDVEHLERDLGRAAMKFRGNRGVHDREEAITDYAYTVRRLIETGRWELMPAFEDMLPDEHMPDEFFDHFGLRRPDREMLKKLNKEWGLD